MRNLSSVHIVTLVFTTVGTTPACTTERDSGGFESGSGGGSGSGSGAESASGSDAGSASGSGPSSGSGEGDGDSDTPDSGSGGGETSGSGGSGGIRLDVADGSGSGGAEGGACDPSNQECGCNAVDVLLVIDDSKSMGAYQAGLAAAAPGFADAMFESLPPGTDLHVGVTTSNFWGAGGGQSPGERNCEPFYAGIGLSGRDDFYEWYWLPDTMPFERNGAQGRLREHDGLAYFEVNTDEDPAAMKAWLAGNITAVGEKGSVFEMVAAGAAYPFHPANAMANEGFLRDQGAVLAIFVLTDEIGNSPEDVAVYHDLIADAKRGCGGDRCIVTGGILDPCTKDSADNVIYPLLSSFGKEPIIADIGPELQGCFEDCMSGSITECNVLMPPMACPDLLAGQGTPQYQQALGATLADVIAKTCEEIPPVG